MDEHKKINILIVHYNTPEMTECLVRSINKFVGTDCTIYIFDNSDKLPFTYRQDNIVLFDNTKGQIIDFEKWLEKYPKHYLSGGKCNNFASAKHCYSVEACFDLISDNFILLDSDTLLTSDISTIVNDNFIFVGEVERQNNKTISRVLPILCFINVKKCKTMGIHFFNENYMHGLNKTDINAKCEYYDTGAFFLLDASKGPYKVLHCDEYIKHFGGGVLDAQ